MEKETELNPMLVKDDATDYIEITKTKTDFHKKGQIWAVGGSAENSMHISLAENMLKNGYAKKTTFEKYKEYVINVRKNELEKGFNKQVRSNNEITLQLVHKVVEKWLYLKNMNRVDLILAVHLSRLLSGTKLWLIIIGGSGGTKSELLKLLDDNGEDTFVLQEITTNTLVSGNPMSEDLAPKLNNKTTLIYDMAILLNLRKDDKAKIWAQLRELYDGNCRKETGSGKKAKSYTDLNITLIACSTGAIDNQILIHNSLGTRELLYRIPNSYEKEENDKLMSKVLDNENYEREMRLELKSVVQEFIKGRGVKNIEISENILSKIKEIVSYIIVLRTTPTHDNYHGDLLTTAEQEYPTRILKQLKRLYVCLKSLDPDYSDEKAIEILMEIRDSCCNADRIKILRFLVSDLNEHTFGKIGQNVRLGNSTIKRHLSLLWSLKLVNRYFEDLGMGREVYRWSANMNNDINKMIQNEFKPKVEDIE